MAAPKVSVQLRVHPELQPFIFHDVDVRLTGKKIGSGVFFSVEEVAIPGALCAAKKIREFLTTDDMCSRSVGKLVNECKMMGTLRHPNVVQFLGLWFSESGSPAVDTLYLVLEKMLTNLHDLLTFKPTIPFGLKCSILQDIASGIAFLHKQKPPVVHQALSARNVLLNSAMVAKIADIFDMGVARGNVIMTKQPEAPVYKPPEAFDDKATYNTSTNVFSLGVLAIFVLSQEFPWDLKASTYFVKGRPVVRTELERRESYTRKIYCLFPKNHPLIRLIEYSLENNPTARLSIDQVLVLVNKAMLEIKKESAYFQFNKLQLLQTIEHIKDVFQQEKKKSSVERKEAEKLNPCGDGVARLQQENTAMLQEEVARALQNMSTKPHERIQTWLTNVDRDQACELLEDSRKGTFLVRSTSQQSTLPSGGLHTHSIGVVCDGVQHVRIFQQNGKYGITMPCTFISLMELVLHFSENSLSVCNTTISTTLRFPFFCI